MFINVVNFICEKKMIFINVSLFPILEIKNKSIL